MNATVSAEIKGVIGAMKYLQERDGEFAKVNCSFVEEKLNEILLMLEEEKSN